MPTSQRSTSETSIRVIIGNTVLTGRLWDNATARDLLATLGDRHLDRGELPGELRPLVDKLDLPADEKFDTLLLIIRSTDDKTLVNAAFDAAKEIPDENKRAQALLDVIKEIDYFSGHGEQPAA